MTNKCVGCGGCPCRTCLESCTEMADIHRLSLCKFVDDCRAMGGNVSFREALQMRLDIMQVSQEHMADFLASHPPRISPGCLADNGNLDLPAEI